MTTQLSLLLTIEQNQACVHINIQSLNKETNVILTELVMLIWHRFPSWLVGKEIPLELVCLPYDKTAHSVEYPLIFSTNNIRYNTKTAKMFFPLKYLALPCQRSSIELMDYIEKLPDYLITETNTSIENIANILGYTEASAFSRVFKQWTGSSPRDYRHSFV